MLLLTLLSASDSNDGTSSSSSGSVTDDYATTLTAAATGGSSFSSTSAAAADSVVATGASLSTSVKGLGSSSTLKSRLKGKSDAAKKVCAFCKFVWRFLAVSFLRRFPVDSIARPSKVSLVS